ncbi:DUF5681 domain-containing protein [Nereida sp. MMG025]|uniref:DUF5681 domain-containing protein n=1 Tax=Nereida sp. MMG025 TaxID=2909981 RepID=UPI001F446261|nr:DUF5681 domain-containing protein [Nereida sp. MMG025]MCF6446101.1 DUF5681 domain-containing protein [Nereida sp. MMG025]
MSVRKSDHDVVRLSDNDRLILELTKETVSVQTAQGVRKMNTHEALLRKIVETSMKGSPHAQRNLIRMLSEADAKRQRLRDIEIENAKVYIANAYRKIAKLQAHGLSSDHVLPHPEDIELDPDKGVQLYGPYDMEELQQARCCAMCCWCKMLMSALLKRTGGGSPRVLATAIPWLCFTIWVCPNDLRSATKR